MREALQKLNNFLRDKPIVVVFFLFVLASLLFVPRFSNGQNLGSIVGATVMTREGGLFHSSPFGWLIAILVMLLIGLAVGAINGLALISTQSITVGNLPRAFTAITEGSQESAGNAG